MLMKFFVNPATAAKRRISAPRAGDTGNRARVAATDGLPRSDLPQVICISLIRKVREGSSGLRRLPTGRNESGREMRAAMALPIVSTVAEIGRSVG